MTRARVEDRMLMVGEVLKWASWTRANRERME